MSSLKIISNNVIDSALTLTATSEATGHLIAETQDNIKSKTWRSTTLATQTITATWSTGQDIAGVGLAFTNLIVGSTVQVKLYTLVADGSPALDSGIKTINFAYDPPQGFTSIGSDSFGFGGGGYFSTFFTETNAEKMEIIVTSASNPDSYMEISRIVTGAVWSPEFGFQKGATAGYVDTTKSSRTDSGNSFVDRGIISREIRLDLGTLRASDRAALDQIFRSTGEHFPIYLSMYSGSATESEEVGGQIYGRFSKPSILKVTVPGFYQSAFNVEEI